MIFSMSSRWASEKLCAEAADGAPQSASASRAGASRRNEGIGKFLWVKADWGKPRWSGMTAVRRDRCLVVLLTGRRPCGDDIIGPDPTGGADRETGFRPRGEIACGLVVAAKVGGLRRSEIGLCQISLSGVGHRELGKAERRLGLPRHRRPQDRDRFVGIGLIIGAHEGLPK